MRRFIQILVCGLTLYAVESAALAAETVTYTYDEQGRLVALTTSGTVNNNETVTIVVDPAGNRVTYTVSGS